MSRNEDAQRFEEIMDQILELSQEAYQIARAHGEGERARSYWVAHIAGAVDRRNSGYMGGSMTDMADTLRELRAERCLRCGEVFGGEIQPVASSTDHHGNPGGICQPCSEGAVYGAGEVTR